MEETKNLWYLYLEINLHKKKDQENEATERSEVASGMY